MPSAQTVASIRTYLRAYFDVDDQDMPDTLVDRWISDGWGKIVRFRRNWPGFEAATNLVVTAGVGSYAAPYKDITSISGPDRELTLMSRQEAERAFVRRGVEAPAAAPRAYSVWAGQLRLWPTPAAAGSYSVRGYRVGVNPLDNTITAVLDLPHPDASELLLDWVMYRASLRESEDAMASAYRESFEDGLRLIAADELRAPTHAPVVLNSHTAPSPFPDRLRFPWE